MTTYAGIDPGASGAIAFLDDHYRNAVYDLPVTKDGKANVLDVEALLAYLHHEMPAWVGLEQLNGHAAGGFSSATWSLARNTGAIEATLAARNALTDDRLRLHRVAPTAWQKTFGLVGPYPKGNARKLAHIARARELFPELRDRLIVSKDGRADALLIAEHTRRRVR